MFILFCACCSFCLRFVPLPCACSSLSMSSLSGASRASWLVLSFPGPKPGMNHSLKECQLSSPENGSQTPRSKPLVCSSHVGCQCPLCRQRQEIHILTCAQAHIYTCTVLIYLCVYEFTLILLIPVTPQNKAQLSLFHMLICDSSPMVRNLILVKKIFVVTYLLNPRMHVKPFWEPKLMVFSLVWICAFRKGLGLFVRSLPALLPSLTS